MDELIVQPIGGFVGAGGNSHMKSEGRISISALTPEDRAKVDALFSHPQPPPGNFQYRITRNLAGTSKTIDVPASDVPAALVQSIKTELE